MGFSFGSGKFAFYNCCICTVQHRIFEIATVKNPFFSQQKVVDVGGHQFSWWRNTKIYVVSVHLLLPPGGVPDMDMCGWLA